jgi:drug/metabolite transporter (DMT)-like permease
MKYGKAIVAILAAAAVAVFQARSGDQRIGPTEWVAVAIAAVSAVGVYLVPLAPHAKWTKTAVAVLLAVLQALATVILGGLGTDELITLLITAMGAAGVYLAPAVSPLPGGDEVVVTVGTDG